jgi:hypothetical protein
MGGSSQDAYFEIRQTLYSRYESELQLLYHRSTFLWTFITVLFTAYGFLLKEFYLESYKFSIAVFISTFIVILIGSFFSVLWIAMAKASSAIEESYVWQIEMFENYPDFDFPRDWSYWTPSKGSATDQKLFSLNGGQFSAKKINILISQTVFLFGACS